MNRFLKFMFLLAIAFLYANGLYYIAKVFVLRIPSEPYEVHSAINNFMFLGGLSLMILVVYLDKIKKKILR